MSVLAFPRVYFKGMVSWDPCTFNNNDFSNFPTYDATNAALNWQFLATQKPPITQENFTSTFRPWAIRLQPDANPEGIVVPAEWNMFGTHAVQFTQYQGNTTTITGGTLGPGQFITADPLVGQPVSLDAGGSPAKLVDVNPVSFWSSQIYWSNLQLGGTNISLQGKRAYRMYSRWINLNRIYNAASQLTQPAAAVSACFQTCIPNDQITWTNTPDPQTGVTSPLLSSLQAAATAPGAQGVMVRFTAYVNLYFQNGILNDIAQQATTYKELAALLAEAWQAFEKSGDTSKFFSQPCYSHVVGVAGVWNRGDFASAPGDRYLAALNPVTPAGGASPTPLGPASARLDRAGGVLSIDLNSAIPELAGSAGPNLAKSDIGTLTVGAWANGAIVSLGQIPYSQYDQQAYEASGGIVDVPIPVTPEVYAAIDTGHLIVQAGALTVLAEQTGCYAVQTDQRGIYLDEGETREFRVDVRLRGLPAPGANVLVVKYDNNLNVIPADASQFVDFTTGAQQTVVIPGSSGGASISTAATVVTAGADGAAMVGIASRKPGFPVLAFFPFAAGQPLPIPPAALMGQGVQVNNIGNAFYTAIRVLPFDSQVPKEFTDLWNTTHDPDKAWSFIYNRILYVYDMLFSVMLKYVNLGDRTSVEQNLPYILPAISKAAAAESPGAMPVTRDMSAGKRRTMQLWASLVKAGYKVPTLDENIETSSDGRAA